MTSSGWTKPEKQEQKYCRKKGRYLLTYKKVKLKQTREIFLRQDLFWALTEY
ncbi:MAG: hypothetical protein K8R09_03655 [Desulfobacterales bacterium]|nr:hypothetical protein [Desulfobacterales bacterium]